MKKVFLSFILVLFANIAFAQMSDEQVINYVKQEYAKGTSQQDIATNLAKRGVNKDQLERIKLQQETKQATTQENTGRSVSELTRTRKTEIQSLDSNKNVNLEKNASEFELDFVDGESVLETKASKPEIQIFGRNIFNTKNLTFNPDVNIPTPIDYRLGPGDEVVIDIWGASQTSVRQTISPEGSIMVDRLGPLYLNGMTIKDANNYVQRKFSEIYAGIDSGGNSQIMLTLGEIRTIQVNVMGEVVQPGTYALSSLSSAFNALYRAGGVNDIGSLRSIKVYRNNKLIQTLDVYQYLMKGKIDNKVTLTDGDVIIVPPYSSLVQISGNVKRPMAYEVQAKETLSDLLDYSGGFSGNAYSKNIKVERSTGGESQIFTVSEDKFNTFSLKDKDLVVVSQGLDNLYENRVEIKGAIFRPGFYEIGKAINTVKDLISVADGLKGDAFLNRAVLTREKEDLSTELISIDIRNLLYGNGDDVVLRKNDVLYIPSINELIEYGDFVIHGEVAVPGEYKYADNTTLEDLIIQAGGLLESASIVRVDIARRIIDNRSTNVSKTLSETFTFEIKDGLVIDGKDGFVLKPYDQVYVRRSPGYREQKNVYLEGEVLFPGAYALNKKTERITDVINRAGSLTPDAYLRGARLVRKMSEEEQFRANLVLKVASKDNKDSISTKSLDLEKTYNVGIELDKAIRYPGSDYDIVLREGDVLIIPEYDNTVKINGAVMYPNTVVYKKGEKISYYINQAGGYSDTAKKKKSFVIYMNGTVSKIKASDRLAIQPGCEIVVPTKDQSRRLSLPEIISLGTSITSMASLIGVLINTMK